jgi:short-subunit dehydrogenase
MQNKVVVITGASQGLGKELSLQLAKLGAKIALVARTEKLLQELKNKINSDGGVAEYFVCDVTDYNQVNSTVTKIIEKFGTIDVLINNAGVWLPDSFSLKDQSRIKNIFEINSMGPIYFSQAVTPIFEKNNSGHFIFINSIAGLSYPVIKDWQIYSATKWALTGFAKSLTYKYDNTPIRVSSIYPGPFSSNIDKNAGDDFGSDRSFEIPTNVIASQIVNIVSAPDNLLIDTLELKNTNWNS